MNFMAAVTICSDFGAPPPNKVWHCFPVPLLLSHFSRARLCATHRRQPNRLPRPGDSPDKNTGVDCHFPLQCMKVKSESDVAQLCPTPSDPMDCSPPGIFPGKGTEVGCRYLLLRQGVSSCSYRTCPQGGSTCPLPRHVSWALSLFPGGMCLQRHQNFVTITST